MITAQCHGCSDTTNVRLYTIMGVALGSVPENVLYCEDCEAHAAVNWTGELASMLDDNGKVVFVKPVTAAVAP
jgi:hypothetical protein